MDLNDKTALVTGATRGIGHAICMELARCGCNIAFNYRNSTAQAEKLAEDLKAIGRKVYVCQSNVDNLAAAEAMVQEAKSHLGTIDFLINNAGITKDNLILRMSEQDWDEVLDTNLKGTFNFSKAVAPIMVKARSGSILNITSISGIIGTPGQTNYAASKAGMIGLTKSLARELAGRNIRVNALALGLIETEMIQSLSEDYRNRTLNSIPLGRFGTTTEVARIAAFLLSDAARYITGQVIQVDGGLGM